MIGLEQAAARNMIKMISVSQNIRMEDAKQLNIVDLNVKKDALLIKAVGVHGMEAIVFQ